MHFVSVDKDCYLIYSYCMDIRTQKILTESLVRRDIAKRLMLVYPGTSLRTIGRVLGVSHETVRYYLTGIRSKKTKMILPESPHLSLEDIKSLGRDILLGKYEYEKT